MKGLESSSRSCIQIKSIVESLLRTQYPWKNNIFHLESAVALILALVLFSHRGSTETGLRLPPHHSPRLRRENRISFCCRSGFIFFSSPSPRVSFHPAAVPSIRSLSNATSGRTLSEVRSASASLRLQPWQLCPNWPTVWQDDCQLLSVRAVRADVRQVWRAPDGSLRHEKESLCRSVAEAEIYFCCILRSATVFLTDFIQELRCIWE